MVGGDAVALTVPEGGAAPRSAVLDLLSSDLFGGHVRVMRQVLMHAFYPKGGVRSRHD